jgi:hypothetical protein
VKFLTKVVVKGKNPDESEFEAEHMVNRINESFYETNAVWFPQANFDVFVDGVDSHGDEFERFLVEVGRGDDDDVKGTFHEVVEGSNFTLNCDSTGAKTAKSEWTMNGKVLMSNEMR